MSTSYRLSTTSIQRTCHVSSLSPHRPSLPFTPPSRPAHKPSPASPRLLLPRPRPSALAPPAALPVALAAAAPAAAPALTSLLTPSLIFSATSALMVPIYALMMFLPSSKLTRGLVSSAVLPVGLSLLYCYVLGAAVSGGLVERVVGLFSLVQAPSYLPDINAVATLFSSPLVTNLAWLHLLLLDFYQARTILVDGIQCSVPTAHSIGLCFLFGPLGLLSHFVTRAVKRAMSSGPQLASAL